MEMNDMTAAIVGTAYHIHQEMGPGLFESVYERVMTDILVTKGFSVQRQVSVPIRFRGKVYDEGFRADLVVEGLDS